MSLMHIKERFFRKTELLIIALFIVIILSACSKQPEEIEAYIMETQESESNPSIGTPMEDAPEYEADSAISPSYFYEPNYSFKDNWIDNHDGTITYNGEKYKRKSNVKAILCAGIDKKGNIGVESDEEYVGSADGIFLVAHDQSNNSVRVFMIPRDSMVDCVMTDPSGNQYTSFDHLNISFGEGDGEKSSAESLKRATSDLLCGLNIDHYFVGNLETLATVNDMVGGVEVVIPSDELAKINPEWTRGKKVRLKGDEAEQFIRYRDADLEGSPILRMDQHRQYISGFYDALKQQCRTDSNVVTKLSDTVESSRISDMSKGEYERLLVDVIQSDFGIDEIVTLPGEVTKGEIDGEVYDEVYLDYTQVIPALLDCFYRKIED